MKRIGAWMLLALLALVGEWHGRCYGCVEEERVGLLEIKALIDPDGFSLRQWVDSSNCCEWYGIECDNTTRLVINSLLVGITAWAIGFSTHLCFSLLKNCKVLIWEIIDWLVAWRMKVSSMFVHLIIIIK